MKEQIIEIKYQDTNLKVSALIRDKSNKWLVCLHGIQSNKELFKSFYTLPSLKDYSLLAIDFIGFGNSSKLENFSYDIKDQAAIAEIIIKKLEIKKLYFIGHSLGGMVATLLLSPLKNAILGFINLEGNLTYEDCGLSKVVAEYSFKDFKENEYLKIKSEIKASGEKSSLLRNKWLNQIPDFAFYKTSLSIVKWSKSNELLRLFTQAKIKKIFVFGSENKPKVGRLPDTIERAEIPTSGHFMLIDNPSGTKSKISEFLISS